MNAEQRDDDPAKEHPVVLFVCENGHVMLRLFGREAVRPADEVTCLECGASARVKTD